MPKRDRITEVGIVIYDGEKITDTFSSLINPERSIPPEITRITGITNDMVEDAPYFYEVAKTIVEMTEGAIFVAHNVRFDYGFLRNEFSSLGFTYTRKLLDTVTLSRKAFPGLRSYSLGNLIRHFDIDVNARHRALDDAMATTIVLEKILKQDYGVEKTKQLIDHGIKASKLPKGITHEYIRSLPNKPGVYYFYNSYQKIVYVGKSINIQSRVIQHFSKITKKAEKMASMVTEISYELTGNELTAMLLESHEIKAYQPEINKAQRTREYRFFIHTYYDHEGYICFEYLKANKKNLQHKTILGFYGSRPAALSDLASASEQLELCHQKMGIQPDDHPCFLYKTERCYGACIGKEDAESYNERASIAADMMKRLFDENFILVLRGRTEEEKAVVLVEEGNYRGYGYVINEDLDYGVEEIKESIRYVPVTPEANGIIKTYLNKHPLTKKITF